MVLSAERSQVIEILKENLIPSRDLLAERRVLSTEYNIYRGGFNTIKK